MSILNTLIEAYEQMANDIKRKPYQSRDLAKDIEGYEDSRPYFWTRHMRKSGRICFANIVLPEMSRGQKVFTRLLEYIEANPNDFTGVEVEQVYEPRLQNYLKRLGWEDDLKKREAAKRDLIRTVESASQKHNKPIPDELGNLLAESPRALTLWRDFTHNATGEEEL